MPTTSSFVASALSASKIRADASRQGSRKSARAESVVQLFRTPRARAESTAGGRVAESCDTIRQAGARRLALDMQIPSPNADAILTEGFDDHRWRSLSSETTHEPWRTLPGHMARSSLGRPWSGLSVWHQVGPAGDLYIPPVMTHSILLRRSTPTGLAQRQGDAVAQTLWRPGEAVVVPAGLPSFWRSTASRDNIIIHLAPAWLLRVAGREVQLKSCFGQSDPVLAGFAQVLLGSLDNNISLNPAFGEDLAQCVARHLLENYADRSLSHPATASLSRRQMTRLVAAVGAALHEPWPISRLADLAGLSPFHFARTFKVSFGTTPHAWINLQRMEAAERLVHDSRMPLLEVAEATGYASAAHFSHAFRLHWGVTPSAYRRSLAASGPDQVLP
jgi:AraC family transcriptional regulator